MATPPPKTDDQLFKELVEAVLKDEQWNRWHQDAHAGVEYSASGNYYKLKGLIRAENGQREWWPYEVDMRRVRKEGPQAIAREFMREYAKQRDPAWGKR